MHSLPLTPKRKQTELTLLRRIAQNNNFPQKLTQNLQIQCKKKMNRNETNENNKTKNGLPSHTTVQE